MEICIYIKYIYNNINIFMDVYIYGYCLGTVNIQPNKDDRNKSHAFNFLISITWLFSLGPSLSNSESINFSINQIWLNQRNSKIKNLSLLFFCCQFEGSEPHKQETLLTLVNGNNKSQEHSKCQQREEKNIFS